MNDFMLLGKKIRQLRQDKGMTQKEFAHFVGCTAATLSAYENGTKSPALIVVKNIAESCGVSLDWLCGLDEDNSIMKVCKTYKDLAEILVKLHDIFPFEICKENGIGMGKNYPCSVYELQYKDYILQDFLMTWGEMLKLLKNKTIDEHLYQLWIVDKMEKLNGLDLSDPEAAAEKYYADREVSEDNDQEMNDSITKGV